MMTYDPAKAVAAQEKYCEENNAPFFAPNARCGYRCYYCNQNIYMPLANLFDGDAIEGVSVEEAGSRLITGCPFCHYSYVD